MSIKTNPTTQNLQQVLDAVQEAARAAHREINRLAQGKRRWTMSIPVEKDDSDMVLQKPLDYLETLLEIVQAQAEALKNIQCNQAMGSTGFFLSSTALTTTLQRLSSLAGKETKV